MNRKTLEKYAEMKDFQKSYNGQVKEQEGKVIKAMKREGAQTAKLEVGTFSLIQYKTWEYSSITTAAAKHLAELEQFERDNGVAKVVGEKDGVRFTPSKN